MLNFNQIIHCESHVPCRKTQFHPPRRLNIESSLLVALVVWRASVHVSLTLKDNVCKTVINTVNMLKE